MNTHIFQQYFKHYSVADAPFMHQQFEEWANIRPLAGLKILHHVPVVCNTLLKVACLIEAGAEVTITNPSSFVTADPKTVSFLLQNGLRYEEVLNELTEEKWDIYLDCGAELYQALGAPNIGAVELTGSGDQYYRQHHVNFPVLSIDHSQTKQLETVFGSSESVAQAIKILKNINPTEKSWLIFGFGKIGRGIAHYCVQNHIPVTIIEPLPEAQAVAQSLGLKVIYPDDLLAVESAIKYSEIIITATGQANIMEARANASKFL